MRTIRPDTRFWTTTATFVITLTGVIYAAYLTYVEIWAIDAICQWCVLSAITTTAILLVESVALWKLLAVEE